MANIRFRDDIKEVLDRMLLELEGVVPGKMFGYPGYYVNKKLFACLYEDGVGIKVPAAQAAALIGQEGISHFQPLGRKKMKEWIEIDREDADDYRNDREIFITALTFVAGLM